MTKKTMTNSTGPLPVLVIGGTGTISASLVRLLSSRGTDVYVLNRGTNARHRDLPDAVVSLTADIADPKTIQSAIGDLEFQSVVNFLSFDASDARRAVDIFGGRTAQYIHISTASMYHKPILQVPITESNARQNRFLSYARDKIEVEDLLMDAYSRDDFPTTIVRPSHTYDTASPPLPGGWTVFDRIERGAEMVVHGDGTSLWTLTHAADLAVGLAGLVGNARAIGEAFHITSDDVYTWDQIYALVADSLGVQAHLVHATSESFVAAAPEWGWSELFLGDLGHSAIFDNSKIKRYVPDFSPKRTFVRSVVEMAQWRRENPSLAAGEPLAESVYDRMAKGYHASRAIFEDLGGSA